MEAADCRYATRVQVPHARKGESFVSYGQGKRRYLSELVMGLVGFSFQVELTIPLPEWRKRMGLRVGG